MESTRTSDKPSQPKRIKDRKCRICRKEFPPISSLQVVCGPECAIKRLAVERNKRELAQNRATAKEIKVRKEKIKTRSEYIKECQIAFNSYIRERDKARQCISCGSILNLSAIGGGFDCGHYRSVGSAPHLRFDENNAHGQCKKCNRYGSGMAVDYRMGLIARIGMQAVEALESDQEPRKWSVEELKSIKAHYRAKLRELKLKSNE